jgi:hypothetical protein
MLLLEREKDSLTANKIKQFSDSSTTALWQ